MTKIFCRIIVMLLFLTGSMYADLLLWEEDFSDISDWRVGYDPDGGSTITTDGSLGLMYVNGTNSEAAFIPDTGIKDFVPFEPSGKEDYTMHLEVDSLSLSVSYDVALDLFDDAETWLDTVWNVYPAAGTTTNTGLINVDLGTFTYDASTAYLMPKIDVHTGDGGQTVRFDRMSFTQAVPEPGSAGLFLAGLIGLYLLVSYRMRRF